MEAILEDAQVSVVRLTFNSVEDQAWLQNKRITFHLLIVELVLLFKNYSSYNDTKMYFIFQSIFLEYNTY